MCIHNSRYTHFQPAVSLPTPDIKGGNSKNPRLCYSPISEKGRRELVRIWRRDLGPPVATSKSLGLGLFSVTLPASHHPCYPKSPSNSRVQVGGTERLRRQRLPLPRVFCAFCQSQRVKCQGWVWRKGKHRQPGSMHLNLHPGLKERIWMLRERAVHRQVRGAEEPPQERWAIVSDRVKQCGKGRFVPRS